jgi:hypothetical protein
MLRVLSAALCVAVAAAHQQERLVDPDGCTTITMVGVTCCYMYILSCFYY